MQKNTGKNAVSVRGGAKSGALVIQDPDLYKLIRNWRKLPAAVRTGILAMVRATNRNS